MSRLQTMARFDEPDESKPITTCDECDAELYEGDQVLEFDNEEFCSSECLISKIGVTTKYL